MKRLIAIALSAALAGGWLMRQGAAWGQAQEGGQGSQPTGASSDDPGMIRPLLPVNRSKAPPLMPEPDAPVFDETTQRMIPPRPPQVMLVQEGAFRVNRVGQLRSTPEGKKEFVFAWEADVQTDPPMIVLPNRTLAAMERYVESHPESWFRVNYRVTQYYPRNYMMIESATPTTRPATQPTTMQSPEALPARDDDFLVPGMRPPLLPMR